MTKPRLEDDFDNHVNYMWKAEHPIPDEYPRFTNFTQIDMALEKIKMEIATNPENKFISHIYNIFIENNEDFTDYSLDSLDVMSLQLEIEKLLDVNLGDDFDIANNNSINLLYKYIDEML